MNKDNKCICEGSGKFTDNLYLELRGNILSIDYCVGCRCGAFEEEVEIKFCPLCGKELKDDK